MGSELIKVTPSLEVNLDFPDNMSRDIVSAAGIVAMSVVPGLAKAGMAATGAIIQRVEETRVKIAFYRERGRYLREYVVPTLALFDAVQVGRNIVNSSGWDDDLRQMAWEDLNKVLEKYRTK